MWIKKTVRRALISLFSVMLVLGCVGTVAVAAIGVWAYSELDADLDTHLLETGADRTTRLYCYNDNGEAIELASDRVSGYENALWCPISEIAPDLINAFVAIEDKRFFSHGGIDWARTAHAVWDYVRGGDGHFGGSTITQQLIKNLTGDSERSVRRKVTELLRAVKIEKSLSKQEILERYLNVVNLAQGCYGVRTAANAYFSKEPSELTLDEAATIAAITNNPSRYNPIRHPAQNRARRDVILREMLAQGMIDEARCNTALAKETVLNVQEAAFSGRVNSWYADLVIHDVIDALVRECGYTEAAAGNLVYCGGLRIYTAMSPALQEIVENFYKDPDNFPTHQGGKKAQSGLLLVDPKSGDILAVAGAIGEKDSNRVQSFATDTRRPSGSVIKPLSVYAPALKRGLITWSTVFDDIPLDFKQDGAPWPRNSPNVYRGLTTVNTALTHSVNTVAIKVLERLGQKNAYRFLCEELGFTSLDQNDIGAAALALGQQHNGVTLREIVAGYTVLAGQGSYREVRSFYRVLDSEGNLLLENSGEERRVLETADAAILTMMLRNAVQQGTGSALSLKSEVEVAGKTGTTGNNCDKWFVGYTPELLCGVWYGYEYPAPLNDVKGNPALAIFDTVMHLALEKRPISMRQFETPGDVVVLRYCKDSGCLIGDCCHLDPRGDRTEYGYFKRGTEPHGQCDRHVCISYCTHGGVASEHCPEECRKTVALLRVDREFPRRITVLDAPYTYGGVCFTEGRKLTYNEPYYVDISGSKRFVGVKTGLVPYNRVCPVHTADTFWKRRVDAS